jgi:hypothetical protein
MAPPNSWQLDRRSVKFQDQREHLFFFCRMTSLRTEKGARVRVSNCRRLAMTFALVGRLLELRKKSYLWSQFTSK